jgi:hypothetical protein
MQHYFLMLDERQAERVKRAQSILQNRSLDKLAELQTQRQTLADSLEHAKNQQNGQIFMSQQSQNWLERINRSEQRLAKIAQLKLDLGQTPLAASYTKRVQRAKGRLIWQASEALPKNQWQAQKALNQLDGELADAQISQQLLLEQLASKPDFTEQRQRVSALADRIQTQITTNAELQDSLITELSNTFLQYIEQHTQKVNNYILQAQLAIVRLNDQALQKQSENTPLSGAATDTTNQAEQL